MNTDVLHQGERRRADRRQSPSSRGGAQADAARSTAMGNYGRFAAMVATSTAIGFAATYLNVLLWDHVFFSWTRFFMAMIMGGVMTAVMMAFMWNMYPNRKANWAVLGAAGALFLGGLALVRSQATVDQVAYMEAMIPHHSIAILTSTRASIEDPRVRKLADGIIEAQRREIAEMKKLVSELKER